MYANGSGIMDFDPWKGLLLFIMMMMGALNVVKSQSYDLTLSFSPDCWGYETSWEFRDSDGNVMDDIDAGDYSSGFSNGPGTYTHTLTVSDGLCYQFEVFDTYGDGMTGSVWGSCNVDGDFEITDSSGNVILELDDPDFGDDVEYSFCITAGCTDSNASNYNSSANVSDGNCTYPAPTSSFTYSQTSSGCAITVIAFNNTSTLASSYAWTFENGIPATSDDANPTVTFPTGSDFKVTLTATNGSGSDASDQTLTIALDEIGELVTLVFSPDCWGSDIAWELKDGSNNVLASVAYGDYIDEFPLYTGEEHHEICMTDGCYTLDITDASDDGLEGDDYFWCDEDGTFWFEDKAGNTILEFDDEPDYGDSHQETLCVDYTFIWTGALDDDWQNAGNWQDNQVPSSQHTAVISQTNYAPTMNETVELERLIIDENSEINFANSSGKFKLEGDFVNQGIFDADKGMVIFQGDEIQYIKGVTSTFFKMKLNSNDSVILLADMNLRGPLIPTKGVFSFNDQELTLISEEGYTGSIGQIKNNAEINGDTITIQRYFPAGPGSWRMLCTPIKGITFEQWNDDIPTTGFSGANYPTYPSAANPWSNIRYYDESLVEGADSDLDAGFTSISDITDVIDHTKGYFVYLVPGPTTIDVRGPFHKYDETIDLTFSESNTDAFNDGWNLISNPYPSAIDWDKTSGWTKGDLNNAVYAYDPINAQYSSYVNGVSVGSMDGKIASSQAFWVKSESGSPTLEILEMAKMNTTGVHMRSSDINTQTVIRIKLFSEGQWDEAVVGFHTDATDGFDGILDAYKFFAPDEDLPNLASTMDTSTNYMANLLSINMLPIPDTEIPVDLVIRKGGYSDFMIANEMVDSYDENLCLVLEDHELGVSVEFNQGDYYMFTQGDESPENRFSLHLSAPLVHTQIDESCPGVADGSIEAEGFGPAPWNYIWMNADGEVIQETPGSSSVDMISALTPGFYTVTVENEMEQCASATKVIEVLAAPEEWADAEVLSLTCTNENTATMEISMAEHYMWDILVNGSNGELVQQIAGFQGDTVLTGLPGDNFEIIVISQCGTQHDLYDLDTRSPQSVEANFSSDTEAINLANSGTAVFYNNTVNGLEFVWNFGDGTIDSTNVDGQHLYTGIGLYEVTLFASNSYCSGSYTDIVAVIWNEMDDGNDNTTEIYTLDPDKITDMELVDLDTKMDINYGPQNIIVRSQIIVEQSVVFQIFNSVGQLIHTEQRDAMDTSPIELQIGHLAQGVFYLNILTGDIILKSEKFLKN